MITLDNKPNILCHLNIIDIHFNNKSTKIHSTNSLKINNNSILRCQNNIPSITFITGCSISTLEAI